jgi:hypothetical protein
MSLSSSLLKNLEIISELKTYDKLNTSSDILYIDNCSSFQFIYRYYYGSSRINTISKLREICEEIEKYITESGFTLIEIQTLLTPPINNGCSNNKKYRQKLQKYKQNKKTISPEIQDNGKILLSLLPKVIQGINNLIETYKDDSITVEELKLINNKLINLIEK